MGAARAPTCARVACSAAVTSLAGTHDSRPSPSPSTRRAMMLSWISDVPPSIVLARERSQSRVLLQLVAVEAGSLPAEPAEAGELHAQLLAPLVELGAVELEHRAPSGVAAALRRQRAR